MKTTDYIDVDIAAPVVAAAELVAAARDGYLGRLPAPLLPLFERHRIALVSSGMVADARSALSRVMTNSELRDLWHEGSNGADRGSAWMIDVKSVLDRLK